MIVKIIGNKQTYYFEGTQIYKRRYKSENELKSYSASMIIEDNQNVNYSLITIFNACEELKLIGTNCLTYLMNENGKTIERIN